MVERLRAVPAWGWLAAIVFASFAFRAWLARGMVGPFIMVDELIYSELAKNLAAGAGLLVRDVPTRGYGLVYPITIAPAYAVFERVPDAYAALKTINSLVMSLAAIPAYLLARRVVRPDLALAAAVLAVAVPSMAYTGTVMSENAFYPSFLLAALALVVMLERPTPARQLLFVAIVGFAVLVRPQAIVLVPTALTAPLLLGLLAGEGLRHVRHLAPLYGLAIGGGSLLALVQLARGSSLNALLGAYAVVGEGRYDAGKAAHFLLYHVAELDLYLGVIPVAAVLVLCAAARRLDRPLQVMLAATVSLVGWFSVVVAVFASRFSDRIQERNLFVVAPLLVICLLAWVERGASRPRLPTTVAAASAALLVLAIPFERFVNTSAQSDTLMLLPWYSVQDWTGLDWIPELALLLALAFALAFAFVPARFAALLPVVLLGYWAVTFKPVWFGPHGVRQAAAGALFTGIRGVPRDWIDAAVPSGAEVGVLWRTGSADRFTVNQNEFFNRRVGTIYAINGATPGGEGFGEIAVAVGRDGVVRRPDGSPVRERYVLADPAAEVTGHLLARDAGLGTTLWRVDGPLRLASTTITGVYADTWSGPRVTWTRKQCVGGVVTATLSGDARLLPGGNVVTASSGERARVLPNALVNLRVPVHAVDGTCRVVFVVAPTAVPAEVFPGSTDTRALGAHFRFLYEP